MDKNTENTQYHVHDAHFLMQITIANELDTQCPKIYTFYAKKQVFYNQRYTLFQ